MLRHMFEGNIEACMAACVPPHCMFRGQRTPSPVYGSASRDSCACPNLSPPFPPAIHNPPARTALGNETLCRTTRAEAESSCRSGPVQMRPRAIDGTPASETLAGTIPTGVLSEFFYTGPLNFSRHPTIRNDEALSCIRITRGTRREIWQERTAPRRPTGR